MAEHLIYVKNWFPKYEVDCAEQMHYSVFKTSTVTTKNVPASIPADIAKSIIIIDIKPWDDETDLNAMEQAIRTIKADGLLWGQSKQILVAYGIKKLQIGCVIEDDKIGIDFLEEKICQFDEYVQSVDIVSFTKL